MDGFTVSCTRVKLRIKPVSLCIGIMWCFFWKLSIMVLSFVVASVLKVLSYSGVHSIGRQRPLVIKIGMCVMFRLSAEYCAKSAISPLWHSLLLPKSLIPCIVSCVIISAELFVLILIKSWFKPRTQGSVLSELSYGYLEYNSLLFFSCLAWTTMQLYPARRKSRIIDNLIVLSI